MAMEPSELLGLLGLIISVPTAMGAALALVRSSYNKARLEDSDRENARLRTRLTDCETQCAGLKVQVAHLTEEKITLGELVTQRAELEEHRQMVYTNHNIIINKLDEIQEEVRQHGN